jgi:SAM-dependent methyltransferase
MSLFTWVTPQMLEKTGCPVCLSPEVLPKRYRFEPFEVVACGRCPVWYLSPRLDSMAIQIAYKEHYFEDGELGYNAYERQEQSLKLTFKWLLEMLVREGVIRPPSRRSREDHSLLEIGCAYGYLLEIAQDYFDALMGTEFSDAAAARARRAAVNAQVHVGGIESIPADQHFDVVLCTQVIEHIYKPHQFIRDVLDRLKPGGWLVMTTPNMDSWWRILLGHRWPSFKIPEHVVYYNGKGLCRLLESHGMRSVQPFIPHECFALSTMLEKFGINIHRDVLDLPVWVHGTSVGIMGRRNA